MLTIETMMSQLSHRPFPLPGTPWVMFQQWSDLLFAHWAVEPGEVRAMVPAGLELDLFDGKAWLSVTPFRMTDLHLRGLPAIPGAGSFLEMNFRTYVRFTGKTGARSREHGAPGTEPGDSLEKPGIFFFSLDASNLPAVVGARIGFGLPYFWSDMTATPTGDGIDYISRRRQSPAAVEVRYAPTGPLKPAKTELEVFLTERYCLYETRAGTVMRTEIHHIPWPLQPAKAEFRRNTLGEVHKIPMPLQPDLVQFSRQLDVVVFPPEIAG